MNRLMSIFRLQRPDVRAAVSVFLDCDLGSGKNPDFEMNDKRFRNAFPMHPNRLKANETTRSAVDV